MDYSYASSSVGVEEALSAHLWLQLCQLLTLIVCELSVPWLRRISRTLQVLPVLLFILSFLFSQLRPGCRQLFGQLFHGSTRSSGVSSKKQAERLLNVIFINNLACHKKLHEKQGYIKEQWHLVCNSQEGWKLASQPDDTDLVSQSFSLFLIGSARPPHTQLQACSSSLQFLVCFMLRSFVT